MYTLTIMTLHLVGLYYRTGRLNVEMKVGTRIEFLGIWGRGEKAADVGIFDRVESLIVFDLPLFGRIM
jgi:hypothetical protein